MVENTVLTQSVAILNDIVLKQDLCYTFMIQVP